MFCCVYLWLESQDASRAYPAISSAMTNPWDVIVNCMPDDTHNGGMRSFNLSYLFGGCSCWLSKNYFWSRQLIGSNFCILTNVLQKTAQSLRVVFAAVVFVVWFFLGTKLSWQVVATEELFRVCTQRRGGQKLDKLSESRLSRLRSPGYVRDPADRRSLCLLRSVPRHCPRRWERRWVALCPQPFVCHLRYSTHAAWGGGSFNTMKAVRGDSMTCFSKELHRHRYFWITDKIPQTLPRMRAKVIIIIHLQVFVPASNELMRWYHT